MAYDLIVIGGGPGGYVAAIRAAQLGMKTALVEKQDLGGTCLNRGCIPTKSLLHTAEIFGSAQRWASYGINVSGLELDFPRMHARKQEVVDQLRAGVAQLLKANHVDVIGGEGRVAAPGRVTVGDTEYETDKILIASGSEPVKPPIPGIDLPNVVTSETLLEGDGAWFKRLIIIGGGVMGVELASIYAALGAEVMIIEAKERLLPMMDREISQNLNMILKKRGIRVFTGARVEEITKAEAGLCCRFTQKNIQQSAEGDGVLISIGRRACTADLFEEHCIPETDRGYLKVDSRYQTSVQGVYAAGDVIGGIQLAHTAEAEGIAAVEYMSGAETLSVDPALVPSCVYTSPEIGCVGITADEAKAAGRSAKTGKFLMSANGKSLIADEERGFVKLVFDSESEVLIGAQLMCGRATDLISELTVAISAGLTREQIAKAMHPHPTFSEGIAEAAEAAAGHSIHSAPPRR